MRSLVNKAFVQIQQTGSVRLFKSHHPDYRHGEFGRHFLYVKDAVEMTRHFAAKQSGRLADLVGVHWPHPEKVDGRSQKDQLSLGK